MITHKVRMEDAMRHTEMVFISIIFLATTFTEAHEGLFLKFSVGPGVTIETAGINKTGVTIAAKNHSVGWAFNRFAVFFGEFGGLIRQDFDEYNYINLDAFGPGIIWYAPHAVQLSFSGGYGQTAFARKWTEATGDVKSKGYGINMSLDKEWMIAKRFGLGTGAQTFYIRTKNNDFTFLNFSLKGMVTFYLTPIR